MKILIFGSDGMLGNALIDECMKRGHSFYGFVHKNCDITDLNQVIEAINSCSPDVMINAAGLIPDTDGHWRSYSDYHMMQTNAVGPLVLASAAKFMHKFLLHVSTDCVFSGIKSGIRTVTEVPDPKDLYGVSKRAGELCQRGDVVVVRTSFIGQQHGLMRWLLDQPPNAQINGYSHAMWSGSLVQSVANGMIDILEDGPISGLHHLSTAQPISKFEVLRLLAEKFRPDITVNNQSVVVHRALKPTIELMSLEKALEKYD